MELSKNLIKYLRMYIILEDTNDIDIQDKLLSKMEDLYYELNDDDIAYLEEKQII